MRIIQLVPSLYYGDAVGNDVMALRGALSGFGYETNIYAEGIDIRRQEKFIHHYTEMPELSNDDVLIYHFASGSETMADLLKKTSCRKIMYYHNITPSYFFSQYDMTSEIATRNGRRELVELKDVFEAALCASRYNLTDLKSLDYDCPMAVLPILIPFDDYNKEPSRDIIEAYKNDGYVNFLFVGRVVPNKKQEDVIGAFAYYHGHINNKSRLFIVGNLNGRYAQRLIDYVKKLRLDDSVIFTGSIPFSEILAYYKLADVFLCMSEHEGFCVPLLEAMYFDVPIIAYDKSAVAETMGTGTGVITDKSPVYVANCVHYLLTNSEARKQIIEAQRKRLKDFDNNKIKQEFRILLNKIKTKEYDCFDNYELETNKGGIFSNIHINGKGDNGSIIGFEKIKMPDEMIVKNKGYKIIKYAYERLKKVSPKLAMWGRNILHRK